MSDTRVEQHAVGAKLHGHGHIAGSTHSGINNDGIIGYPAVSRILEEFEDGEDCSGVGNPASGSDGASGGHHTGRACIAKTNCHYGIIAGVAHHIETVVMQFPARFQGSHRVRQQCLLVAEDFELDPMAARIVELLENLPAESRHPDGIPGGKAARGVGENRIAIRIDEIQHRATFSINQAFPADRDGDDLSAGKVQGLPHDLVVLIFPRPHNETIRNRAASQPQGFIGRDMLFDFDSGGHEFFIHLPRG